MSGLGALSKIIAARVPRAQPWPGVRPETLRLIELQTHDPFGASLGRDATREEELKRLLQSATPVLRRKSLTDLLSGKLQSVHESGRTGAAAGAKLSAEARAKLEPGLFGDKGQSYGSLLAVPQQLAPVSLRHPERPAWVQGALRSEGASQQYGRYGLVPHDKYDRATFTLGDSLDNSKAGPLSPYDLHQFMTDLEHPYSPNWFGSAAWELSDDVVNRSAEAERALSGLPADDIYRAHGAEFRSTLQELGADGLKPAESYYAPTNFRLLPRRLDAPFVVPMTPHEKSRSARVERDLAGDDLGYVEYQLHGDVTPDRISKVIDYGIAPSTATEKKLRKLGIDYEPVAGPETLLAQFSALKKRDAALREWLAAMESRGNEASEYLTRELPRWPMPNFDSMLVADHYAHGGLAA